MEEVSYQIVFFFFFFFFFQSFPPSLKNPVCHEDGSLCHLVSFDIALRVCIRRLIDSSVRVALGSFRRRSLNLI